MELDLDAVHHLLRHLNNLPYLRENVLVAKVFTQSDEPQHTIHARIREVISNALDLTLAQHGPDDAVRAARWEAIVRECDLGGKSRAIVADELGLSRRQFYRERRAAHEAIAGHVLRELTDAWVVEQAFREPPSEGALQIEYAQALQGFRRLDEAIETLERVARSPYDLATRLHAIGDLLEMVSADGGRERIGPLIDLSLALARSTMPVEAATEAELSTIGTYDLNPDHSAAYVRGMERALNQLLRLPATRRQAELAVRAALKLGSHLLLKDGNKSASERYLAIAKSLVDRNPTLDPSLAIHYNEVLADFHLNTSGPAHAREWHRKNFNIARRHHAPYYLARASYNLAVSCNALGDLRQAELHGRNTLLLAEQIHWSKSAALSEQILAEIYLQRNDAETALRWIGSAVKRPLPSEVWRSIFNITAADALERLGRIGEALDLINRSCAEIESAGYLRYLGPAEQQRAKIYARARKRKAALVAMDKALELLERFGMLSQLVTAYELSSHLTKNASHYNRARELREFLTG